MMLRIATFLLLSLTVSNAVAQTADDAIQTIDGFASKNEIEAIPDIQQKLRTVIKDVARSAYERSRALTYLMYWPQANRAFLNEVSGLSPALKKSAMWALVYHFNTDLTAAELVLFDNAVLSGDRSEATVALMASEKLPETAAKNLLNLAQQSPLKEVADRAIKMSVRRFGQKK